MEPNDFCIHCFNITLRDLYLQFINCIHVILCQNFPKLIDNNLYTGGLTLTLPLIFEERDAKRQWTKKDDEEASQTMTCRVWTRDLAHAGLWYPMVRYWLGDHCWQRFGTSVCLRFMMSLPLISLCTPITQHSRIFWC